MKKSQLRKIIKESIKELMNEQSYVQGPNTDPPYNWSTIQDAYTAVQYQNWHFVNPNDPTQGNVTINYSVCVDQAIDGGYLDASAQTGGGVFGLVCSGIGTSPYDLNFFNSPFQLNINTPPTGMSLMDAANDPNSGFYDQSGCNAACNQYQQSQQISGCRYPNACNYDPNANWGGSSLCQWGPAGPNYGALETPHPCPSTPTPTPLVAGCNVSTSSNYDMYADGCEVNGIIDPNDVSCCVAVQPGGGVTPTNISANPTQLATQGKQLTTPIPSDPSDSQMKRMKDLAFRGKR